MFTASPFKLQMYEQCPQKYKFRYVDNLGKEYETPRPYLTMGAHVHNALKDFYEKYSAGERTLPLLEELLRKRWRENRRGFFDVEDERKWGMKALQMLKLFFHKMDVKQNPMLLEDFYKFQVDDRLEVLGRIDRIDEEKDGLHVIDYKTGNFSEDSVSEIQLKIYSLIMKAKLGKPVRKASFLYLPNFQWYTIEPREEDYDFIMEELKLEVKKIVADRVFKPAVSRFCKNCDFLEICPAQEQATEFFEEHEHARQ